MRKYAVCLCCAFLLVLAALAGDGLGAGYQENDPLGIREFVAKTLNIGNVAIKYSQPKGYIAAPDFIVEENKRIYKKIQNGVLEVFAVYISTDDSKNIDNRLNYGFKDYLILVYNNYFNSNNITLQEFNNIEMHIDKYNLLQLPDITHGSMHVRSSGMHQEINGNKMFCIISMVYLKGKAIQLYQYRRIINRSSVELFINEYKKVILQFNFTTTP